MLHHSINLLVRILSAGWKSYPVTKPLMQTCKPHPKPVEVKNSTKYLEILLREWDCWTVFFPLFEDWHFGNILEYLT